MAVVPVHSPGSGEESAWGQVQGPCGAIGRWTGQQGRGHRRGARAQRRTRTRAQHATSPSRPTSCPPGKHADPLPRLLDRCFMIYQRGRGARQ